MDNLYFIISEIINYNRDICFLIIGLIIGFVIGFITSIYKKNIFKWLLISHDSNKYHWPLKENTFNKEFQVIQMISYGGFGEVYKVLNKYDKKTYAIKKVKLNGKFKFYYNLKEWFNE